MHHLFNGWMQGVDKKLKYKILVGTCTLCWAIWISRNDVVFDKVRVFNPMQVIFQGRTGFHCCRRRNAHKSNKGAVCLRPPSWKSL
jgi:hypothetical protein